MAAQMRGRKSAAESPAPHKNLLSRHKAGRTRSTPWITGVAHRGRGTVMVRLLGSTFQSVAVKVTAPDGARLTEARRTLAWVEMRAGQKRRRTVMASSVR